MRADTMISGDVDEGFGPVADVLRDNLSRGYDLGAGVAVFRGDRPVVDIWGGMAKRRGRVSFTHETLVPVFSAGKGMVALAAAVAVSRGWLGFDDPVARAWPEFAANGKEDVTLRHVLDHRSGVALFGRRMTPRDFADPNRVDAVLAAAVPLWPPGTAKGYHLATFGDLVAGVLRRADPNRRSFRDLFADIIARPLGASVTFGRPAGASDPPLARLALPSPRFAASEFARVERRLFRAFRPGSLLSRALLEVRRHPLDDPRWLAPPFPSGNCLATASGLAAVYGSLADGGRALGLTADVFDDLRAPPDIPPRGDQDAILGIRARWRLGFSRPSPSFPFWPSEAAMGSPGLGGAFGLADPDTGIGYAYVPNRLGILPFDDGRERALRQAVLRCLS